jgi:hypothetical protein
MRAKRANIRGRNEFKIDEPMDPRWNTRHKQRGSTLVRGRCYGLGLNIRGWGHCSPFLGWGWSAVLGNWLNPCIG